MRRQARIAVGGAFVVRTASALQVWLWLLIFVFQNEFRISRSIQPGYLDFDNLPETNFTCTGKVIGGYYADLETSCQMFHVCTVGQQDEPMDIKFLCLNGTVFDQETRVCERVDEVDCTKSEKFYSLNLELYGSTAPPIIQPDPTKPQAKPTEQSMNQNNEDKENGSDERTSKPNYENTQTIVEEHIDSTDNPLHVLVHEDVPKVNPSLPPSVEHITQHVEPVEENQEEEEIDSESPDYEEEYASAAPSTTHSALTTTIYTTTIGTTTTIARQTTLPTSPTYPPTLPPQPPSLPPSRPPTQTVPALDPSLLSPQEFIYHNRGKGGAEAISFQRQGFRPADGVYITHAPSQQFDHFQYESSRTVPRPVNTNPSPFVPRPAPSPFRATTLDPRDQLSRPGPSSQPSERYESKTKHKYSYPSLQPLPAQRPLPYDPFYFKRSDDSGLNTEPSLTARSAIPPRISERPPLKPKSPPRVIVTASASVSDSNGKRLNYTVGNVVSAVKPIVQINYDDYKESDLIFDPFFLDVPKLQKRRKTRADTKKVLAISATTTTRDPSLSFTTTTVSPGTPTVTTVAPSKGTTTVTTTTAWNPDDYVDDNYEPQAYLPPVPPITYLLPLDKYKSVQERQSLINYVDAKIGDVEKEKVRRLEQSKPALSPVRTQVSSSQNPIASTTVTQTAAVVSCDQHTTDCRSRV